MSLLRISLRLVALLVVILFSALGAFAQYRGGVQGAVLDPQGAAVSDAKVIVTAKETGISQEATTDDKGVYSITRLAPGVYKVTVEKAGFKT